MMFIECIHIHVPGEYSLEILSLLNDLPQISSTACSQLQTATVIKQEEEKVEGWRYDTCSSNENRYTNCYAENSYTYMYVPMK